MGVECLNPLVVFENLKPCYALWDRSYLKFALQQLIIHITQPIKIIFCLCYCWRTSGIHSVLEYGYYRKQGVDDRLWGCKRCNVDKHGFWISYLVCSHLCPLLSMFITGGLSSWMVWAHECPTMWKQECLLFTLFVFKTCQCSNLGADTTVCDLSDQSHAVNSQSEHLNFYKFIQFVACLQRLFTNNSWKEKKNATFMGQLIHNKSFVQLRVHMNMFLCTIV